jgi:hypothetical protein
MFFVTLKFGLYCTDLTLKLINFRLKLKYTNLTIRFQSHKNQTLRFQSHKIENGDSPANTQSARNKQQNEIQGEASEESDLFKELSLLLLFFKCIYLADSIFYGYD